jgi:hypothetical protein
MRLERDAITAFERQSDKSRFDSYPCVRAPQGFATIPVMKSKYTFP